MTDLATSVAGSAPPAPDDEESVEAVFRFLGTDVHVVSRSVRQVQYWNAVYAAFRVPAGAPPDIRIRLSGPVGDPMVPAPMIEADGVRRPWDGREELMPPLGVVPLDRWLYLEGAVVGRAGHSALLLAPPGAGKTSLVIAAVARGAWLLTDGLVPLDPGDLLVLPFPKSLRLPRSALSLLGIAPSHPALSPFRTRSGEIQWRSEPRALIGPRASDVAADVGALVLLDAEQRGTEAALVPMAPEAAFIHLVRHLAQRPARTRDAADALVRLARRAPAYVLSPASPQATAAVLDRLLLG